MHRLILRRVMGATLLAFALWSPASAHCIVGNRFFPATLTVDDPCVNDELSIPTIAAFKNGDEPSADELDISGEYSKTVTRTLGFRWARRGCISTSLVVVLTLASITSPLRSNINSSKTQAAS